MYTREFIINNLTGIRRIDYLGKHYLVDYFNFANETDENEECFVVVDVTEKYIVDNQNKYERLYVSDLANKEGVTLFKFSPMEEKEI